jgi:hypothetical protein
MLTKLTTLYKSLRDQISTLTNEVGKYLHYTPSFDNQTIKMLSKLYDAGWNLLHLSVIRRYSWLSDNTSDMQKWIQLSDPYVVRAREKYQAFSTTRSQLEKHFRETKNQLEEQKRFVNRKWGWVRSELLPIIEKTESELMIQISEWKRFEERKWAEHTIHEAILRCEHLAKFSEQLLYELNMEIAGVSQRQIVLSNRVKDIKRVSANKSQKLSQEEQQEIQALIRLAMRAEYYETAETLINYADSLALKQANRQVKKDIKHIININSGGGAVVIGNVKTGRDFVGRDVKTYNTPRR